MKKAFPFLILFAISTGIGAGLSGLSLFPHEAEADGNVPPNGSAPVSVVSIQAATSCTESSVAAASQAVVTVPAVSGQYFYITSITVMLNAIAAPVATLMATTTTNVPGAYTVRQAVQAAVGTQQYIDTLNVPLKSSVVGTAVVFTGPTGLTNVSQHIRICGFYAP